MAYSDPTARLEQPDRQQDRLFRIFFWIVVAGSLLAYFWGTWAVPLLTHNEGRRLVVLREMLASRDWLMPTKNGELYLQKPPLFYWFGALFAKLADSRAEWVLRLPSGLSALLATWLLFFGLRRHIGRWAALLGALALVTSHFFTLKARLAELNMLLTLCVFAAVVFFFEYAVGARRRCLYLAFAALGLAFMTKGPVALLFFVPGVLFYGLLRKDRRVLRGLADWRGWLLFAVIALPWYLYVNARLQGLPMLSVIRHEMAAKVVEETKQGEPFYYYVRFLLGAFAPWVLILLYRPVRTAKQLASSRAGLFFGLAALVPLLVFSLFDYKRTKYILPMYPALAVLLGMALDRWRCAADTELVRRRIARGLVVAGALLVLLLGGYYAALQPRLLAYRYAMLKPLALQIDELRGRAPVYYVEEEPIELIYYYGRPIPGVDREGIARLLDEGAPFLLLVKKKQRAAVADLPLTLLDRVAPYLSRRGEMLLYGSEALAATVVPGPGPSSPL